MGPSIHVLYEVRKIIHGYVGVLYIYKLVNDVQAYIADVAPVNFHNFPRSPVKLPSYATIHVCDRDS